MHKTARICQFLCFMHTPDGRNKNFHGKQDRGYESRVRETNGSHSCEALERTSSWDRVPVLLPE